jgi:hypothetical protein
VPRKGLEPLCLAAPDPKSGASANFATSAQTIEHGAISVPIRELAILEFNLPEN